MSVCKKTMFALSIRYFLLQYLCNYKAKTIANTTRA